MALPEPNIAWPPLAYRPALDRMRDADAWYSGDPDQLFRIYSLRSTQHPQNRPSQYRRGVVGMISRWFWGEPTSLGEKRTKLHVPLAADIATGSADLLFSEAPTITFDDPKNQARWEQIADDIGLNARLSEAAEITAALGGGYLRSGWDRTLAPHPLLEVISADGGLPEFRYGMLRAVTLWRVVRDDNMVIWRHVERHELDANGRGIVLNALYQGTVDNLGRKRPLSENPATEDLEDQVKTGIPGLLVIYVPNMLPDRLDRASSLGRSDYQGIEGLMDSLDETYTSWQRDIRLSKARIIVPNSYMRANGPGKGASFDLEQEVYQGVETLPKSDGGLDMMAQQFDIRVAEFHETCQQWMRKAVESAGYSAGTFGLKDENGGTITATEVRAQERKSFITRQKKINYWSPALRQLAETLLAIDNTHLSGPAAPERPQIDFPDGVSENPLVLAQTVLALEGAQAASTEVKVRMLHPDWDDTEITEEVKRIHTETGRGVTVEDPGTFRGGPPEQTAFEE